MLCCLPMFPGELLTVDGYGDRSTRRVFVTLLVCGGGNLLVAPRAWSEVLFAHEIQGLQCGGRECARSRKRMFSPGRERTTGGALL